MKTNVNDLSYHRLIEKQRAWVYGLPESEYLLPLMKLRMSSSEADFLHKIPHLPSTLDQLQKITGIEADALRSNLDDMAAKGLIMKISGSKDSRYMLNDAFFWFYRMPGYAGKDDAFNREISPILNRYYRDRMAETVHRHSKKGLRTVPIRTSIQDARTVMPFEDVASIIEESRFACVSTCACRHRRNLDPDEENCKHETRTCLHFDTLGRYLAENGLGEKISKPEALEIAQRCADSGLVHGVSNTRHGVDTICNCCSCCCAFIETKLVLPGNLRKGHQPSNYFARVDHEKCKKCGLCSKRCPMNALQLVERDGAQKEITFSQERCIGCGVCAHGCPTGAVRLHRHEKEEQYPESLIALAQSMLRDQGIAI